MSTDSQIHDPYKQTLQYVYDHGVMRGDRTGKGRHSVFSPPDEIYDLSTQILPLTTLRDIKPDATVDELLWFISGSTNIDDLKFKFFWQKWVPTADDLYKYCEAAGIQIDKEVTQIKSCTTGKDVSEIVRFTAPPEIAARVGTIGNLYGVSWRDAPGPEGVLLPVRKMADLPKTLLERFVAETDIESDKDLNAISIPELIKYLDEDSDDHIESSEIKATIRGAILKEYWKNFDQLNELVYKIKNTPYSSRLRVSAYLTNYMAFEEFTPQENTMDGRACLTPCHTFFQCYVHAPTEEGVRGKLDLKLTLTSSDVPVGRIYNVAQYSILCAMLAQVCGLDRGRLIVSTGDAHIYGNQMEFIPELLSRESLPYPTLTLNPEIKSIFDFTAKDISIDGYVSHPAMKIPVAL